MQLWPYQFQGPQDDFYMCLKEPTSFNTFQAWLNQAVLALLTYKACKFSNYECSLQ